MEGMGGVEMDKNRYPSGALIIVKSKNNCSEANPELNWRDVQHIAIYTANPEPLRHEPGHNLYFLHQIEMRIVFVKEQIFQNEPHFLDNVQKKNDGGTIL